MKKERNSTLSRTVLWGIALFGLAVIILINIVKPDAATDGTVVKGNTVEIEIPADAMPTGATGAEPAAEAPVETPAVEETLAPESAPEATAPVTDTPEAEDVSGEKKAEEPVSAPQESPAN